MRNVTKLVVTIIAVVAVAGGALQAQAAEVDYDYGSWVPPGAPAGTVGDWNGGENYPWVTISPCPWGVSRPAGAFVDGHFLIVGGEPRDGYVQKYDSVTDTWDDTGALMPTPMSNICAAAVGTDVYIPGGYDGVNYLADLQVYHHDTDTWEVIATDPLPFTPSGVACTAYNGKVYAVGGNTPTGYTDAFYVYDPAAPAGSRWTALAVAPFAGGYGDLIAAEGGIFYAGFRDSIGDRADVFRYDPMADAWTTYPSLTTARAGARFWVHEGYLSVGAGGWSGYFTSVEQYDLSAGAGGVWMAGNPLNIGRRTFAAAQDPVSGHLYAGAGWAAAYLADAERSVVEMGLIFADGFESGDTSAWTITTP